MPVYEYRCSNGHTFEVTQRMSDDPVTTCQVCGAPVERVFHPVAVHFKGSGFYTTDYAKKKAPAGTESAPKKDAKEPAAKAESASTTSDKSSSGSESTSSGSGSKSSSE